jgi:DNA-binding MarR family transcriptional regulator
MINKLVRHRLVRRSEGAVDRREKSVVLSASGTELLDRIAAARAARFDASLAVLPSTVAARFAAVLVEVVDALGKRRPGSETVGRPR